MGEELEGCYLDQAVAEALSAFEVIDFDRPNTWLIVAIEKCS